MWRNENSPKQTTHRIFYVSTHNQIRIEWKQDDSKHSRKIRNEAHHLYTYFAIHTLTRERVSSL